MGQLTGARSLTRSLGSRVLQELQRQPVDGQLVVARQRGHGVAGGAEAVHEDQRQRGVVLLAEVEHLAGDDVEEREPAAHAEQRLGAVHAHRGAEAAVELDDGGAPDRGGGVVGADLDVAQRPRCRPARSWTRGSSRSRRARAAGSSGRRCRWRPRPRRPRPSCRGPCSALNYPCCDRRLVRWPLRNSTPVTTPRPRRLGRQDRPARPAADRPPPPLAARAVGGRRARSRCA